MQKRIDVDAETDRLYWKILDAADAFQAGLTAGRTALPGNNNPHPGHTFDHAEWRRGWLTGTQELVREDA